MNKAIAALGTTAFLALAAAPANADGPAGSCPQPYTLTAISDIPPIGQPGAIALDGRGNNDGYVCLMPFHNPNHPGGPFNAIEDRLQAP